MKVLLINGSPHEKGCTFTALSEVEKVLKAAGVETQWVWIGKQPVAGCTACLSCRKTGRCIVDDPVNSIIDRLDEIDGLVIGSPVYYAGAAGQLCAFLDRLFYTASSKMAGKLGAAVVSCRRGGATAAFDRLNKYFTICNMAVIGSQYWNQVHGNNPEEVKQDLEGMQTMRTLGQNIVYQLQNRAAGEQAGVKRPEYEPSQRTNFIR